MWKEKRNVAYVDVPFLCDHRESRESTQHNQLPMVRVEDTATRGPILVRSCQFYNKGSQIGLCGGRSKDLSQDKVLFSLRKLTWMFGDEPHLPKDAQHCPATHTNLDLCCSVVQSS